MKGVKMKQNTDVDIVRIGTITLVAILIAAYFGFFHWLYGG
jgi:hypothetical protein